MPHRHRRPHDVYDDTQYAPLSNDEITVHHYPSSSHERQWHHNHQQQQYPYHDNQLVQPIEPFDNMGRTIARMEREMMRAFEAPFGGGVFDQIGNVMSSFDRMFDNMNNPASAPPGSTYYYESSTTTVGPDGQVHQETVRTRPGADGNPETTRYVRDGDQVRRAHPQDRIESSPHNPINDDVIIEEVDDDDDLAPSSERRGDQRHHNRDNLNRRNSAGGWIRDRFNNWMSHN
ncbi:hypothetical protein BWQ96_00603 [Gracilariopsis chorda]|uniref:Uncharacterized protein n=1 Tax=Gracilariopsis chorda TaxID=448386 RepID=A0A2V3J5E5_9FLOR|nr:hypothetical protein BWQ96_00603 [Gracilariopsis chorda]|eukprot:PXF49533.1 hypothetical protein BWQ96_00603 [Gracilariopsis chorda]